MAPTELHYRDYKKFNDDSKTGLKQNLATNSSTYENFEQAFLALLDKHAPFKSKKIRANCIRQKTLERQSVKKRSQLKTKYFKTNTAESLRLYKKQNNFFSKLYKKEREKYYYSLKLNKVTFGKLKNVFCLIKEQI